MIKAYTTKNADFDIHPLGIPEAPKCEAIRCGNCGKASTACAAAQSAIAPKIILGSRVPPISLLESGIN
jgi:predicted nuclease of predicted toxin-antitoxin system